MNAKKDQALSLQEQARRRLLRQQEEERQRKRIRQLVTPEGAALNLRIASASERAGALILDFVIQFAIILAIAFGVSFVASEFGYRGWQVAGALVTVLVFFIRNFYFILFELGRRAATPGKRALGLRVAARNGGRLTANAVIARNFMRELEVFLPLSFLLSPGNDGVSGWISLMGVIWSLVFLLFPLFNKDKLRVGDLIAGTMVIHAPRVQLLKDITAAKTDRGEAPRFVFTPGQLDAYGIHELHVLEDVLRQSTAGIKQSVAGRIQEKIGWQLAADETDLAFLEAYYAALRQRLEQAMLFGERKADKFDTKRKRG